MLYIASLHPAFESRIDEYTSLFNLEDFNLQVRTGVKHLESNQSNQKIFVVRKAKAQLITAQ